MDPKKDRHGTGGDHQKGRHEALRFPNLVFFLDSGFLDGLQAAQTSRVLLPSGPPKVPQKGAFSTGRRAPKRPACGSQIPKKLEQNEYGGAETRAKRTSVCQNSSQTLISEQKLEPDARFRSKTRARRLFSVQNSSQTHVGVSKLEPNACRCVKTRAKCLFSVQNSNQALIFGPKLEPDARPDSQTWFWSPGF